MAIRCNYLLSFEQFLSELFVDLQNRPVRPNSGEAGRLR